LQAELKKSSIEKDELVKQLKQEIESLKESSQLADNSSYYQSVRESIAEENDYRDMPLQIGIGRSRQRSVRLKEEGKDKYQQELERV
jgi:hypothetical protein